MNEERLFDAPPPPEADTRVALPPTSHEALVLRAERWLRNSRRCRAVLLEPGYGTPSEVPDAIGWAKGVSVVVECKATRKDFLADRRKPSRAPAAGDGSGLGDERWYMTPPGLARPEELPEGWGLLEVRGSRVYREVPAPGRPPHADCLRRERNILVSCLAAVQRRDAGLELLPSRHLERNLGRRPEGEEGGA